MSGLTPFSLDDLDLAHPLPNDLLDENGRILASAGESLDERRFKALRNCTGGTAYVQSEPLSADDPSPGQQVIEQLEAQEAEADTVHELRRHRRHAWRVPLTLHVVENFCEHPRSRDIFVTTVDLSRGGFAFEFGSYIHPGTRIEALFHTLPRRPNLIAVVRHCQYVSNQRHRVGVEFVEFR